MALKLRAYETQAKLSIGLAIGAAVSMFGTVFLLLRNFDATNFLIAYRSSSMYMPALGATILLSLGLATIGFFVGLNSAGQKRNKQSQLSWIGFFLNASVITLSLCCGVFFWFTRWAEG